MYKFRSIIIQNIIEKFNVVKNVFTIYIHKYRRFTFTCLQRYMILCESPHISTFNCFSQIVST